MENMQELNLNQMEMVSGGAWRTVNTGVEGLNAALRAEAKKSSRQIGSIQNGTSVDVLDTSLTRDDESGRNYVYVTCNGKSGWIAASIVGLPR